MPFLKMGTHPSIQILHFNHSFGFADLRVRNHFDHIDSLAKTMSNACTNKAVGLSQNVNTTNVNCNLHPMYQKLVCHCPKTPYFCNQNSHSSLICHKSSPFYLKRSLFCAQATNFRLYSTLTSEVISCSQFVSINSEISSFLKRIPRIFLIRQYQHPCRWLKHTQLLSNSRARRSNSSYLRRHILYSFHLQSPNFSPSSKLSPLVSIWSSMISSSVLSSSVSSHIFSSSSSPYTIESKGLHTWRWLSGDDNSEKENKISSDKKPVMAVVLLGWLGSQQKHLRKYADWYNARGFHAVTFVIPTNDLLSFKPGEKAEHHIENFAQELASWMSGKEDDGRERHVMFHIFSNTGWLSYGVILEKFLMLGDFYDKIKGCVIDSAPEPEPNPQVWALGFSAALLKKPNRLMHLTSENGVENSPKNDSNVIKSTEQTDPPLSEVALLAILEKFFSVVLKLSYVERRLAEVTSILSKNQPPCPQLYIYSSADKVIPAESVESFIKGQRKEGRTVIAYDMKTTPHVDHFRSFPHIYTEQLHNFIEVCSQVVSQ
ncbi:uncharacterized protein LOC131029477 [Cryptomeria japonica]|uniref:uncharacterized protein LOC131029477 n=1 Tax=Cryptomeria japonica TaxID=3369 RepID=UPI0025ACF33E|nr:uncharacterized protein LOC131029477 [Cryptomeria japonica]